ncbi:hypothetical protein VPH35_070638 [Triticum aestivum]
MTPQYIHSMVAYGSVYKQEAYDRRQESIDEESDEAVEKMVKPKSIKVKDVDVDRTTDLSMPVLAPYTWPCPHIGGGGGILAPILNSCFSNAIIIIIIEICCCYVGNDRKLLEKWPLVFHGLLQRIPHMGLWRVSQISILLCLNWYLVV